jgi:hypothetical protein
MLATAAICAITGNVANAQLKVVNNNVGIGTPTVSNTQGWGRVLDVYNADNSKLLVRNNTVKIGLFAHNNWNGGMFGRIGTESSHNLKLMAGYGNDVMTLTTDGDVGIGTPTPAYKLDVNGAGRFGSNSLSVILGTYKPTCTGTFVHGETYSAVYSSGSSLLFGIPSSWAYAAFSENIYYNSIWWHSRPTNVSLCYKWALADVTRITTWQQTLAIKGAASEGVQYAFNPEELQVVFPQLVTVYDTCDGGEPKYAIDYVGMVPILTAAINEQQVVIETQQGKIGILQDVAFGQEKDLLELRKTVIELQKIISVCCKESGYYTRQDSSSNNNNLQEEAILYQNIPNPFSSNTEISCYVPEISSNAFIYIYNLQGTELMSFPITQTGLNTVYVYASSLPAGMYLYTLVVDNQIIDSKRMILTK